MAVAAATANLGDWRTWATEKREILARSNADRAALIEENKRLRASLDIRGIEAEARLRSADEDRARLSSEVNALNTSRNRAESELRSVYRQWEEDGRRWAAERKQLTDQLESMLAAAMQGSFPSIAADKDHSVFSA
jgi:chromosome segregation ATPase